MFWFPTIFATSLSLALLLFFPETCRKVVGDGLVPPPKLNKSLTSFLLRERARAKAGIAVDSAQQEAVAKHYRLGFPDPLSTLVIIADKEAGLVLFSNGLVFACLHAILTGMPSQFTEIYGFDEIQLGLAFIPFGFGSLLSAFTTGKAVDWNHRRHAQRLGFPAVKNRQQDLRNFPIEKVRLQVALPLLHLGAAAMIACGWVIDFETSLAGRPLILVFVIGYAIVAAYQVMAILMVDVYPGRRATATAADNLVRCPLGAGATAVVIPMLDATGRGWTYTFASLVWVLFRPCLWALMKYGPDWRKEKTEKEEKAKVPKAKLEKARSEEAMEEEEKTEEARMEVEKMEEGKADEQSTQEKNKEKTVATRQVAPDVEGATAERAG